MSGGSNSAGPAAHSWHGTGPPREPSSRRARRARPPPPGFPPAQLRPPPRRRQHGRPSAGRRLRRPQSRLPRREAIQHSSSRLPRRTAPDPCRRRRHRCRFLRPGRRLRRPTRRAPDAASKTMRRCVSAANAGSLCRGRPCSRVPAQAARRRPRRSRGGTGSSVVARATPGGRRGRPTDTAFRCGTGRCAG